VGLKSRDWHSAKADHPRDGMTFRDGRTDCNGYEGWSDFIITLVVVNSHKFFSYTD
jgi:hypothetical protein